MLQEPVLDYEQLVAQYQHDLFHLLRGHCSLDYLEIWVPDEDPVKSLLNMVEAAQSCGRDTLVVDLSSATMSGLDTTRLIDALEDLGSVTLTPANDVMRLTVARSAGADQPPSPYRRKLDERSQSIRHAGTLPGETSFTLVRTEIDGTGSLAVRVDDDGVVREAAHDGATGFLRSALDVMCTIMCGRPLQEAADHGVIRLESLLRDRSIAPVLPGIMHAEAAEPLFGYVQKLVRSLYSVYLTGAGVRPKQNTFADAPRAAWLSLSTDMQLERVRETLEHALIDCAADADDARVLQIEHGDRVMIAFRQSVAPIHKARLALALEVALQTHCDGTLQVFLADVKDENAARRL